MNSASAHPAPPIRVLIIEDSEDDAFLLTNSFRRAGYALDSVCVDNAAAMKSALATKTWDAVLSDHNMPAFSAMAALRIMQEVGQDLPFIIVSGVISEEAAVAAMRAGAHDYLSKDSLDRLVPAVEREIREARNRAEKRAALKAVEDSEARFRALVSNIPGVVFQLAQDENGKTYFAYVSDGILPMIGHPAEDVMRDAALFFNAILPDHLHDLNKTLTDPSVLSQGIYWEGRIRHADGQVKWIDLRSSPRTQDTGRMLWEGIVTDISESKSVQSALFDSHRQLMELSSHLDTVKEEERERIARDIHDELGGMLVAIKFEAALLNTKLAKSAQKTKDHATHIAELTDEAINTAGRVARELRPGILKDFGLAAAIECQAEDFAQRTGIACDTSTIDHGVEPDQKTALALFRIAQETLTNVAKHSQATQVQIILLEKGEHLILEITDNGRGISNDDIGKPKSFGLRSIRERAHMLNGESTIERRQTTGTRFRVQVPYFPSNPEPTDLPDQPELDFDK